MLSILKNKPTNIKVLAPLNGQVLSLEEIPDPAFMFLGQGIGIDPEDGEVFSPVDGKVTALFPTNHAIGITTKEGLEILIHIGVNTIEMNGEGFTAHVKADDKVVQGQGLISFSLEQVKQRATSPITAVVITNSDKFRGIECLTKQVAHKGNTVIITVKNN